VTILRFVRDRLRALVLGDRVADEIREELQHHLDMRTAEYEGRGLAPDVARREAERRVGHLTLLQDRGYDVRGGGLAEEILIDVWYALRMFRRNAGWTAATIATLAIGIGANTAIFSTARALLLRPLPYFQPDRLYMLWIGTRNSPPPIRGIITPRHVLDWKARNTSLADLAVVEEWAARSDMSTADGQQRLLVSFASTNFFDLVGVKAALGRTFTPDDRGDPPSVLVISDRLWRRQFGANPQVIGQAIDLPVAQSGSARTMRRVTVVGVLPPEFHFTYPQETEGWLPRSWSEIEGVIPGRLSVLLYQTVARLQPGLTGAQAQADMDLVNTAMAQDQRIPASFRSRVGESLIRLEPMQEWAVGQTRPALTILAITTTFLLVIACVNVVSLLLARIVLRSRELAVRSALGAGPRRVNRQLATEGVVLATLGGFAGVGTALLLQPLFRRALPSAFPRIDEIAVDSVALGWAVVLTAVVALVAGVVQSRVRSRADLQTIMKQGGPTATGDRRAARWRQVLVAAQVSVVVCLMVGSGLLLRTLWNLQHVDLGFDGRGVLSMEFRQYDPKYYSVERQRAFQSDLLSRVRAVPGVAMASIVNTLPLLNRTDGDRLLSLPTPTGRTRVHFRGAEPSYFPLMGLRLRRGRLYEPGETGSIVVSESAAQVLFPNEDPLGKMLESSMVLPPARVVGVVADVRNRRVDEPGEAAFYAPFEHAAIGSTFRLVVRPSEPGLSLVAAMKTVATAIDPSQPIEGVTTIDEVVAASFADRRFYAAATLVFAAVALLLTIAGVYGVVSRGVTERMKELGVRIVLGASRMEVIGLVLRQGLIPVAAGLVAGAVAASWLSQLLQRFLFGVESFDAATHVAVPVVILLVATLACLIPARRALRIDPIETLRAE